MKTINPDIRFSPKLYPQQVFDLVCYHLGTMKEQSAVPKEQIPGATTCVYHAPDNNCCAVGYFFSDSEYREDMEGLTVTQLAHKHLLPSRLNEHVTFLRALQAIHDTSTNWKNGRVPMKKNLLVIGNIYNVDTSILDIPEMVWNKKGQ